MRWMVVYIPLNQSESPTLVTWHLIMTLFTIHKSHCVCNDVTHPLHSFRSEVTVWNLGGTSSDHPVSFLTSWAVGSLGRGPCIPPSIIQMIICYYNLFIVVHNYSYFWLPFVEYMSFISHASQLPIWHYVVTAGWCNGRKCNDIVTSCLKFDLSDLIPHSLHLTRHTFCTCQWQQ